MSQTNIQIPAEYVVPLDMNGLRGRMLKMPPPKGKTREVLAIYGHHSSLERYYSLAQAVNDYAGVTMPDLPGFGGMDSFYKIHEKPDIDTMADYLASFIKLRYKNQRFTIFAISYGFIIMTRMLQKYPKIAEQVDLLISVVGFTNPDEFKFTKTRFFLYKLGTQFFSYRTSSSFFHNVMLHPAILRTFYSRTHNAKHKFADLSPEEFSEMTDLEVFLWRTNDLRTHMATNHCFLTFDNTKQQINMPVWHIYVSADNYFDNSRVEQNMRKIFTEYHGVEAQVKKHMPNVTADKEEAATLIPEKICQLLNETP